MPDPAYRPGCIPASGPSGRIVVVAPRTERQERKGLSAFLLASLSLTLDAADLRLFQVA
jgi:hypothetical protein